MQKNGSKKQITFEKLDHFENCQKWPHCKGYSVCKMVTLGQKLKMPKTCDKRLYKHIRLFLCKKRLQKATNIWEMRPFWKLAKTATMQRLWPLQSGQFGSKIKIAKKHAKNGCRSTLQLYYAKNGPKKQLIFEKWDHFENWQKWPLCKGLCKVVSLGQKLKMPKTWYKTLYKHIRLVLCKKRLQKATNIWEMRPFFKIGKNGHNAKAIAFAEWSVSVQN